MTFSIWNLETFELFLIHFKPLIVILCHLILTVFPFLNISLGFDYQLLICEIIFLSLFLFLFPTVLSFATKTMISCLLFCSCSFIFYLLIWKHTERLCFEKEKIKDHAWLQCITVYLHKNNTRIQKYIVYI